jgi:hypothetical protein
MDPSLASWYVHATATALSSVSFNLIALTKEMQDQSSLPK